MRLSASKSSASSFYSGLGEQLYDLSGARPALDLNFASNGSLVDSVTGKSLVTHTRASNATYVDGDGIIKNAVTNLLLRSEEFDNASWTKGSSVTISANDSSAPDGTVTADKVESTGTTASANQCIQFLSPARAVVSGDTYTFSVYLKADAPTTTRLRIANIGDGDGSLDTVSVTTEWQRFETTRTFTGSSSNIRCVINYQNDAVTVYAWGAQLEQSSTAGEYVKTTSTINSAPRFDHNPTTGESLGLLVEESRTNNILYSETVLSNVTGGANRNIVDNVETAPDGKTTAASITANAADPYLTINTATGVSAGTYTFSVYLKGDPDNSSQACKLRIEDAGTGLQTGPLFNITTEWQRYSFTATTTGDLEKVRLDIPDIAVSGDIVYVWGLQIEAGSFPTSYIRTSGSTATRSADVASITGTNFSSWYNQTEGTVAVRWNKPWGGNWPSYQSFFVVEETANPTENVISFGTTNGANNQIYWGAKTSNVAQLSYKQYPASGPNSFKHAIAVASNDAAFAHAGAISGRTDDSITLPTVDKADIEAVNSHISRLTYWPTRLSNDTLQTITR